MKFSTLVCWTKFFNHSLKQNPSGQGTGLGLSLNYEVIKAHGGELKVETKEGEGAEFIIVLPGMINNEPIFLKVNVFKQR